MLFIRYCLIFSLCFGIVHASMAHANTGRLYEKVGNSRIESHYDTVVTYEKECVAVCQYMTPFCVTFSVTQTHTGLLFYFQLIKMHFSNVNIN